ncbi:hypothetical protein WJX74_000395 [Apatococcus lobatus]|uniref:Uncharacterized protein n=1 Tax=Apatococcus lobatus TaxID=904363 RepID=A0AAW1QV95_9CHLO
MYEHTISKLEPECRQLACRLSTRLRVVFSAFCSTRSWVLRNTCTGVPLEIAGFLQGCSHGRLRSKDSQGRAPDRTSRSRSQERRCSRRCQEVRHLRKKEEQLRTTEEQLREEKLIGLRASGTASSAAGPVTVAAAFTSELIMAAANTAATAASPCKLLETQLLCTRCSVNNLGSVRSTIASPFPHAPDYQSVLCQQGLPGQPRTAPEWQSAEGNDLLPQDMGTSPRAQGAGVQDSQSGCQSACAAHAHPSATSRAYSSFRGII